MPERWRFLGRLMPRGARLALFEPACSDLAIAHLAALAATRSRVARGFRHVGHTLQVAMLVADCWRLTLFGAFTAEAHPRMIERRPTEPVTMLQYHLRHAVRLLVREPGFTTAAVLTLALGVGATTAVFAVVDAVLLRSLPYAGADRLVLLRHRDRSTGATKAFIAMGDYVDLIARQSSFESLDAYGNGQATVVGLGNPFRISVLGAGTSLLSTLGVSPVLGRAFRPDDGRPDAPPVVILGDALWRARFGSDPTVVGRSVNIGGVERQVIGVAPPGFAFPPTAPVDAILPVKVPLAAPADRVADWTFVVGRLERGVNAAGANANLDAISTQLAAAYPASNADSAYFAVPLRDALVGETKPALVLLLAAVGVVLLIACVNVANLLLARSLGRRREMSVRMALGAGRGQLVAQLLAESLVLTLVAGSIGALVAAWGTSALVAMIPASVLTPGLADAHVDPRVLSFALGISAATAVVFGVISSVGLRGESGSGALTATSRLSLDKGTRRAATALVAAEIALAVVLVADAGLVLRSFSHLMAVDPGFRPADVMTVEIALPADRYATSGSRRDLYTRIFDALGGLPGVDGTGAAVVVPLTGNNWSVGFERSDRESSADRPANVGWQLASGGYFKTLGIPLVAGRLFGESDTPATPRVVIVSEALAEQYFPGERAVGHVIRTAGTTAEIVGVVGDVRRADLRDSPRADSVFPFEQSPDSQVTLFVRTSTAPNRLLPSLLATVRSTEPGVTVLASRSMAQVVAASTEVTRFALWLFGLFAVTALALAIVGIYGVMSYVVGQRTREIGMRVALGATPADIVRMVMRQGGTIAGTGTAIGVILTAASSRWLAALLFSVAPGDPATLAAAAGVLALATLAACYVPASRAARVDPTQSLADQ